MKNINQSDGIAKILKDPCLMDSELLPMFEKAENGCLLSQSKLAGAFCGGKGAKQNEELARYFEKLMFETTDDVSIRLSVFWNPAIRAFLNGNTEKGIELFHQAIDYMQENIPMEKWDFSLFQAMERYVQKKR